MTDNEHLQDFVRGRNHRALAELVQRHVDLVYSTALRHVRGDMRAAEEITQQVFVNLAASAQRLVEHPCLAGWLYANTRFTALHTSRHAHRRGSRDRESEIPFEKGTPIADWNRIRPALDDSLDELDERECELVVLRYLCRQPIGAIALQLGSTESATQKGLAAALDSLDAALGRRGIPSTATALTAALNNATVAAPSAVMHQTLRAAAAGAAGGGATRGLTRAIQAAVAGALVAALGLGVGYQIGTKRQRQRGTAETIARENAHLAQAADMQQKLTTANQRIDSLETELVRWHRANETATAAAASAPAAAPSAESGPAATPEAATARVGGIHVIGAIRLPALIQTTSEMSLRDLIDRLGGFTPLARPSAIRVTRRNADGTLTVLTVDATSGAPFMVQPNDIVFVPERVL